jgi:putative transposase
MMCQVLAVSASGYYAWRRRPESAHAQRDRRLRVLVRASFDASKQRYGSPRIYKDLLEQKVRISRKTGDSADARGRIASARPEAVHMHHNE